MELQDKDVGSLAQMPVQERVLERLVDLLIDADDVLAMLKSDDAAEIRWIEPVVRRAYDDVDLAMRRICD